MKPIVFCLTLGTVLVLVFVPPRSPIKTSHLPLVPPMRDTIQFASQIQPILVNRCSPCHFPGGKMYEKLPFDKPETILKLNERLLKRIKDEKENATITAFIEENKK